MFCLLTIPKRDRYRRKRTLRKELEREEAQGKFEEKIVDAETSFRQFPDAPRIQEMGQGNDSEEDYTGL